MLAGASRAGHVEGGDVPVKATNIDTGSEQGNPGRSPLYSLLNGIRVLEAFTVADPLLGVNEIARRVELHNSTVSRILGTLEQADLVERDEHTNRFRLGLGIIGLAGPLLANLDVRRICYPSLERLVDRTGETSALMIWSGHESIVMEQLPSPRQVKHTTPLGTRFSKLASASVRVFLSQQPEAEVHRLLRQGLVNVPSYDDAIVSQVLQELDTVRTNGYATNDGDTDPEELSVSAPIRDHRGIVVAAVLLSAPRFRVTQFMFNDFVKLVRGSAAQVSAQLGAPQDADSTLLRRDLNGSGHTGK